MSDPSSPHQPGPDPARGGARTRITKAVAALAAVAVLAFGANAIANSGTSTATGTGTGTGTQGARPAAGGPAGGMPAHMGTPVTGATLTKLEAAVTAKYPGTVERGLKLPDGSYVVHVLQSNNTEVRVLVSKDFAVTGVQQGGPPAGAPGAGSTAPGGTTSSS